MSTPQEKRSLTIEIAQLSNYIDDLKSVQRGRRIFMYLGDLKTRIDILLLERELNELKEKRSQMNFKK